MTLMIDTLIASVYGANTYSTGGAYSTNSTTTTTSTGSAATNTGSTPTSTGSAATSPTSSTQPQTVPSTQQHQGISTPKGVVATISTNKGFDTGLWAAIIITIAAAACLLIVLAQIHKRRRQV